MNLTTRRFVIHLILMGLFIAVVLFLTLYMIKVYTNHGQKLALPNYIGQDFVSATDDAKDKSFIMVVNDSIHKLGTPGGQILNQNPKPNAQVKENRKIYVTIAKHTPDFLLSDYLPRMYGEDYEMVKKRLENEEIGLIIKSKRHDPSQPNSILEAWYDGVQIVNSYTSKKGIEIEKGKNIEVVISKRTGGVVDLPDFVCMTVAEAKFTLSSYSLQLADVIAADDVIDPEQGFIYKQFPSLANQVEVNMGDPITLYISKNKPQTCQ